VTNVLLITTDQQRADTIAAWGNPVISTPVLDRLAADGTSFTRCRTNNPYCQPARATILTGQYPSSHGVTSNGIDVPADAEAKSVATHFARAGYSTAIIGKAHFASTYPLFPTGKLESVEGSVHMADDWTGPYFGFDHCELVLFGHMLRFAQLMGRWNWCFGPPPFGLHYARHLFRDGFDAGVERLRLMQPEASGEQWDHTQTWKCALPEEEHPTTWIADRAIDWIQKRDDPFFAWVSFPDPHHPMDPPHPWCDMYDPADVTPVLWEPRAEEFDTKPDIHRMWATGARGLPFEWANPGGANFTRQEMARMVAGYYGMISMLDHHVGRVLDALDRSGHRDDTVVIFAVDHGDFLGDHQMVFKGPLHYEGLLRVPVIVRGPGFEAGTTIDEPAGSIDLAPTMLRAAGIGVPDHMEGRQLTDRRETVIVENDHAMVINHSLRTIATRRYKLTRYAHPQDAGELYDLETDPLELENLWDDPAHKATKTDLLATLLDEMNHDVRSEPMVGLVG
jgi:arylsulfatase A-like enzyme